MFTRRGRSYLLGLGIVFVFISLVIGTTGLVTTSGTSNPAGTTAHTIESTAHSTESTVHSTEKSTAHTTEESTAHTTEESTAHSTEESTAQSAEESTAQSAEESTAQSAEESTAHTAEESTAHTAEHTSTPSENTSTPSEHTSTPSEHTSTPSKNTSTPSENTSTPADKTPPPANSTSHPTGHTSPPTGHTSPPTGHTSPPTGHTSPPTGHTPHPTGNTPHPTGNTPHPTGNTSEQSENATNSETAKVTPPPSTITTPQIKSPNITISFNSLVKWNVPFKVDMNNSSSSTYNDTVHKYRPMLEGAYSHFPGYQRIDILNFSNGSVIVNYTAIIDAPFNQDEFKRNIEKVKASLNKTANISTTFLTKELDTSLQQVFETVEDDCEKQDVCSKDELCKTDKSTGRLICESICSNTDGGSKCQKNQICEVNFNKIPLCRCESSTKYVFGGKSCEVEVELLDLSKEQIIAISAGTGGGVILILIVIIIIITVRKNQSKKGSRKKKETDTASEQSFKSMKDSEDGLQQAFRNPPPLDYNNPTFSNFNSHPRLPEVGGKNLRLSSRKSLPRTRGGQADQLNNGNEYVLNQLHGGRQGRNEHYDLLQRDQPDIAKQRVQQELALRQREQPDFARQSRQEQLALRQREQPDFAIQSRQEQLASRQRDDALYGLGQRGRETEMRQSKASQPPSDTQFPYHQASLNNAEYVEIDDNNSKAIMYQPTKAMRPLSEFHRAPTKRPGNDATVYDYSRDAEPAASAHHNSGGNFYDFDYENGPDRGRRQDDPYSLQRPRVSQQNRY